MALFDFDTADSAQPQTKVHALFNRTRAFGHAKRKEWPEPAIQLQEDDKALLALVHRYRILDTKTLRQLVRVLVKGESAQETVKLTPSGTASKAAEVAFATRLRQLWRSYHLDRPPEQLYLKITGVEPHLLWALGRKGYELLAPELALAVDHYRARRMTQKNSEIKASTLAHDLGSNKARACIELATHGHALVRLIYWSTQGTKFTLIPPEHQLRLFKAASEKRLTVVPDGLYGLEHLNEPPPNRAHFYWEFDNGTTPLPRWTLKKGLGYGEYFRQGLCSRQRAFKSFTVLLVAPTPARKESMRTSIARWLQDARHAGSEYPPNLWWFTDRTQYTLDRPASVLAPIWQTASGEERHSLLE